MTRTRCRNTIRRFDLHLKDEKGEGEAGGERADLSNFSPAKCKAIAWRKLTAITPRMNRFQWDLRYPDAAEVTGFYVPIAAGGLTDEVAGPVVAPDTYQVTLDCAGHRSSQSFSVALEPRIHTSQADLDARLALEMQIHETLDALNKTIIRAILERDRLDKAVAGKKLGKSRAKRAIAALDAEIAKLVQLNTQSSESTLLHETKLRSHLAYLQAEIGLAYVKPTAAQYAVYKELAGRAKSGEDKLESAIAAAAKLL
ncbi:MAG: hypothetical protein PVF89_08290 [Lysobacterales bacterium]|jgi:hypothetical protein